MISNPCMTSKSVLGLVEWVSNTPQIYWKTIEGQSISNFVGSISYNTSKNNLKLLMQNVEMYQPTFADGFYYDIKDIISNMLSVGPVTLWDYFKLQFRSTQDGRKFLPQQHYCITDHTTEYGVSDSYGFTLYLDFPTYIDESGNSVDELIWCTFEMSYLEGYNWTDLIVNQQGTLLSGASTHTKGYGYLRYLDMEF